MQAEGTVTRLEGSIARVSVLRQQGCGRCHEPGGCGGQGHGERCQEFLVDNAFGARPGQRVRIEVPEGATLKAALLLYGSPLLALLFGALLGRVSGLGDAAVALGAGLCFAASLALLRLTRKMTFVERVKVRITGILGA